MMVFVQKLMTLLRMCMINRHVGKVIEVDDAVYVSVLNHTGNLITSTKFNEPKQADEVLVKKVREPSGGTKGKRARLFLNEAVLGTII